MSDKINSHEGTKARRNWHFAAALASSIFATYVVYWNGFNQGADTALCAVDLGSTDDAEVTKKKPYCRNAGRSWAQRLHLKNAADIWVLCAFVSSCEILDRQQ